MEGLALCKPTPARATSPKPLGHYAIDQGNKAPGPPEKASVVSHAPAKPDRHGDRVHGIEPVATYSVGESAPVYRSLRIPVPRFLGTAAWVAPIDQHRGVGPR